VSGTGRKNVGYEDAMPADGYRSAQVRYSQFFGGE
jgi:hypothetical protein